MSEDRPQPDRAPRRAAISRRVPPSLWLGLGAVVLLCAGLGDRDVWAPDEPRYAQVAQEILDGTEERGARAWLLLRLGGEAYTQKPPLYYWLAAATGAPSGRVSEWAARWPSALAGLACIALTAVLGRRLFPDGRTGLWAAAVLLTVFRFGHLARRVQLDVLLTGLELGALLLFWTLDRSPRRDPRRVAGFHACLGLALLTKGPVGLLPLAVAGAFLVWEGRGRTLSRALPAWGWLLTLGPVLAWLGAALALAPPGFFQEAVVENLVGRFFEGTSHARPFTYYLVQLPLDFLPWTLLWPAVFIEARRLFRAPPGPAVEAERRTWRFLLAWVGVFFVFFSLSAGKRGLYLLPAFPALALLVGRALDLVLARRVTWPAGLRVALGAVAAVVGCAGLAIALAGGLESPAAPGFALPPAVGWAAAGAMVLAAGLALRAPGRTTPAVRHTLATVVGLGALEAVVLTVAYPAFDPEKSPRPVAQAAVDATPGDGAIGVFDHRAMLGGLAYYSGRRVVALPDAGAVARFWSDGGGAVVVRRTRLERLAGAGPRREVATVRSGRRAVAVVVPGEALPARATRSSSDSAAP